MRLAFFGLVAAGIAGFAAYDQYDKKTNFQRVNAHVSTVTEQCYLEKVERGILSKTTSTSDMLRCELAELLTREHPKWQGYEIKHKIEIQFAFISPVDGATHTSSLRMSAFPDGRALRMGDVFQVLASKTKADKTRQV
ncbi:MULTISPECIES: hypothetical protein [Bradyrhizobium]|jgi:hypothetical protein|uniref:Uncharacterized protein n=1 Tax=Bradyrhizobium arachidis TaxID=858423 RepID=A0AAE7NKX8_9BRAD|nr:MULTISPECIES: hypothetical protein [Bradyrhizobium]QOG20178.1 hypothetical protein FOM02_25330 [Bradyrhizobium sp. SEMIA]QOZ67859.1 hypothetical protein WN72_17255 [Bradyrhizobium arachidis]UFW52501.1 hypothetical protein BaraCB756_16530 [Bradyrhizobium arachidis]SFV10450.1 hypothetical protein SAMN05192541_11617 [Bradyrhizobium arachidis]